MIQIILVVKSNKTIPTKINIAVKMLMQQVFQKKFHIILKQINQIFILIVWEWRKIFSDQCTGSFWWCKTRFLAARARHFNFREFVRVSPSWCFKKLKWCTVDTVYICLCNTYIMLLICAYKHCLNFSRLKDDRRFDYWIIFLRQLQKFWNKYCML